MSADIHSIVSADPALARRLAGLQDDLSEWVLRLSTNVVESHLMRRPDTPASELADLAERAVTGFLAGVRAAGVSPAAEPAARSL